MRLKPGNEKKNAQQELVQLILKIALLVDGNYSIENQGSNQN